MNDSRTNPPTREATRQDAFTRDFPAFVARRRGNEPAWLTKAREDAFASFVERGFPTRKLEAWRYALVKPIAEGEFRASGASAVPPIEALAPFVLDASASSTASPIRAVLLDGRLCRPLSALAGLPAGVRVESLFDALTADPERFRPVLAGGLPADHVFAALATAFFEDGVAVTIAPGTIVERPIEILSLSSGGDVALHPRLVIDAGRASQAKVVETHASLAPGKSLTNVFVDVRLDDGAILDHVKIGDEASDAFHVAATRVELTGRDSTYRSCVVSLGAAFHRHTLSVRLAAEGASCDLNGLYMLRDSQNHDHYTVVDHAVPHTTSTEHYKAVLDDRSRGTFFGRVLVRKDAQKTNSSQKNDNLLISSDALCNSTPQLEILADDVKCAHGSTIGQIQGEMLYYLRSRGIDKASARELLTYAFANEILDRLPIESLRERIARHLTREPQADRLPSRDAE